MHEILTTCSHNISPSTHQYYPSIQESLTELSSEEHSVEYIRRQQATIVGKLAFRTIYELCAKAERMPGTIWMMRWWDQDAVNEPEDYT